MYIFRPLQLLSRKTSERESEQASSRNQEGAECCQSGGWTEAAVFQVEAKSAADRKAMRAKVYVSQSIAFTLSQPQETHSEKLQLAANEFSTEKKQLISLLQQHVRTFSSIFPLFFSFHFTSSPTNSVLQPPPPACQPLLSALPAPCRQHIHPAGPCGHGSGPQC